jgi:NitT/TauT family transport system substrate-binding protein
VMFLARAAMAPGWLTAAVAQPLDGTAGVQGDGSAIRMVINPTGSQCFPALAMKDAGLDKKHGFAAELTSGVTPQSTVISIQSNAVEFGVWNWPDIARMREAGTKVIAVAPSMKWLNTLVVPASSKAQTLADLKGQRVGVTHRNGLDWIVMRALSRRQAGFDLDAETQIKEGSVAILRALLAQGELDAAVMYGDFTPDMVSSGQYRLLSTIQDYVDQLGIPEAPFSVIGARLDYANQHPKNVRAFLAAYRDAVELLLRDDGLWPKYAATLGMNDPASVVRLRDQARGQFLERFGPDTPAAIQKTFDILLETSGPEPLGMSKLPADFITLDYQ